MSDIQLYNAIWQDLLDINRAERYYFARAAHFRTWSIRVRFVLGFTVISTVGTALAPVPDGVSIGLAVAVAVVAVIDLVRDYSRNAALLQTIATDISYLESDYRHLWEDVHADRIPDAHALQRRLELSQRVKMTTARLQVDIDQKLNQRCTIDAYNATEARYAHA